ncbi:aspartic protease 2, partial [Aphelenchoides avenae]
MRLFAATVFAILLLGALSADLIKVPVYEYGDGSYVVQAGIGSPPQKFTLLIDFRDKFLWVPRKDCGTTTANDCPPQCRDPVFCKWICKASCCDRKLIASAGGGRQTCDGLKKFDPSQSSSNKWTSGKLDTIGTYPFMRWPLPYPAASGDISLDTFHIGDLTVASTNIGMARKVDLPSTFDFGYDGVL